MATPIDEHHPTKSNMVTPSGPVGLMSEAETIERMKRTGDKASQARAPRTLTEYAKDWQQFLEFCEPRGLATLPADPATVALFVDDQSERLKPSTVRRRLSAISAAHKSAGMPTPTTHPAIGELLKGIDRIAAERASETGTKVTKQADALLRDDLLLTLPPLNSDRLIDIRDRAILLIGFAGLFRRSEIAGLMVGNAERHGDNCIRFHMPVSKTGPQDREICRASTVAACPIAAYERWITTAGIDGGAVFRSVGKGGKVADKQLSDRSVDRVIRSRTAAAGLVGNYSGHSLRSGAATHAQSLGFSTLQISRAGGWEDGSTTAIRYIRAGETTGLALL